MWPEATYILSADGHYWRNLTLARLGVLPYFVLATVVVFVWTKRLFGSHAGLIAAAVFTFLPTVLAHSGLATTDVAFTALFCWALYAFTLWLQNPCWQTAVYFGVVAGLALSAKFSTIVFLPACGAVVFAMYVAAGHEDWQALLRTFGIAVLCGFLVTWAAYRFSHAPINQVSAIPDHIAARVFGPSSGMTAAVHQVTSTVPVPAPELFDGIRLLREHNRAGRRNYLLGHVKQSGWWYFFVVAIAVKTQLSVLILACIGAVAVARRYLQDRSDWEIAVPLAAAAMVLIVTAPSRLNIGVRHVLPMFVFLSILAGFGVKILWQQSDHRLAFRTCAVLLMVWLVVSSARSHPDYLAYFNEFGGSDPSRLLVVSDLDWGQDLARLANYLHEHQINHISIAYDGYYDPAPLGLPETEILPWCGAQPSGWVALEVRRALRFPECYPWLAQQHSVATVGKTMRIYHLPEKQ